MTDDDGRLRETYRRLAREEPPSALDAAILDASRRAVAPKRARDWGVPVSIAAVALLAVGITFHMQQEEPGVELQEPAARRDLGRSAAPPPPEAQQQAPAAVPEKKVAKPKLQKAAPMEERASGGIAAPVPFPDAPTEKKDLNIAPQARQAPSAERTITTPMRTEALPAPVPAPAAPPAAAPVPSQSAAAGAASPEPKALSAPAFAPRAKREAATADTLSREAQSDDPERELERIARLRADGRDAQADKALEEFRRKWPDYRIPPAMWERVKPR